MPPRRSHHKKTGAFEFKQSGLSPGLPQLLVEFDGLLDGQPKAPELADNPGVKISEFGQKKGG
jgi:hypothetical protein